MHRYFPLFTRVDEGPDTAGQLKLGVLDVPEVLEMLGVLDALGVLGCVRRGR
ncbi:hypothetical protein [Streptomyces roseifaciens]|uniref:hypothetical protein n=1 Tax=Streptomyces roseifaciens TaxID=1488406 RepID=UPI000AF94D43|nr:hypothetical protein [Streptomyces roseifaciens]